MLIGTTAYPHIIRDKELLSEIKDKYNIISTIKGENCTRKSERLITLDTGKALYDKLVEHNISVAN
jgi:hypothetical protein